MARGPGIVQGAVRPVQFDFQKVGQVAEAVAGRRWQGDRRQLERVDGRIRSQQTMFAHESHIKAGVVGDDGRCAKEALKRFYERVDRRRILNIFGMYAGQIGDIGGNWNGGLDQGLKFVDQLAVAKAGDADLNDFICCGAEPGGFEVKGEQFAAHALLRPVHDVLGSIA